MVVEALVVLGSPLFVVLAIVVVDTVVEAAVVGIDGEVYW